MEQIVGFPLSMLIVLIFSIMYLVGHPESTLARGMAYLFGIMLLVSVGFILNVIVIGATQNNMLSNLTFVITFVLAALLFLKAIDVLKTKIFFILLAAVAVLSAAIWFVII